MNGTRPRRPRRSLLRGFARGSSALIALSLLAPLVPLPAAADGGAQLTRLKGTTGFSRAGNGPNADVVTSAQLPDGAVAYAGCSSLASVAFPDQSTLTLGGASKVQVGADDAKPLTFDSGAMRFSVTRPATDALKIETKYGLVAVRRGTGYLVAGNKGLELIAVDAGPGDVAYASTTTIKTLVGGQTLLVPADSSGQPGAPAVSNSSATNNPAIYQFNDGRNPLGTSGSVQTFDPTSSPAPDCKYLGASAGAGGATALLAGLGAAAVAVGVGASHGGGGGGGGGRQTPYPSPTPTGGGTPTPPPTATPTGGVTPTPTPSGTATGGGTPTPTPTATATGGGTPTPTPTATATATGGGTPTPTPTATATGGGTPTPTPTPTGTLGKLSVSPSSVLLQVGVGQPASAQLFATQPGYAGRFRASIACAINLTHPPRVSVAGNVITVSLPAQLLALSVGCNVTVKGGGGQSVVVPVSIIVTAGGPTPTPTGSGGPTPTPTPTGGPKYGPLIVVPSAVLLNVGIGQPASAELTASQRGYSGPFKASIKCLIALGHPPTVSVAGNVITVSLPAQLVALSVGCNVTVTGGGGKKAVVPVTITVTAGGPTPTPTATGSGGPTPTPTPSGGLGQLTVVPSSVLLSVGLGQPASAQLTATQPGFKGKFNATIACALNLTNPPTVSVKGHTVTISLPAQLVTLSLGCAVTVSGGGGQSVVVPVTIDVTVLGGPTPTPTPTGPTPTPTGSVGTLSVSPSSLLLAAGVGQPASAQLTATQPGYGGPFTAGIACAVNLTNPPTVSVSGNTITVSLPAQLLALSLGCNVTVKGGGGQSVVVPVTISVTLLGGSPTPSASPTGGFGPVVANPPAVLLNPGIGQPASQNIAVSQTGYSGAFTAKIACALNLTNPPTVSVNGGTVTVSLPAQLLALSVGCNVTITGGGGQSTVVPVTISVTVLGGPTPTPSPSPSGSGGPTPGPISANPNSVLLNPGIGQPASQNITVSQPNYGGPFTASVACALNLTSPPTVSVNGNVVTVSLPAQLLALSVACNVKIGGGGGQTVTVPVTISVTLLGGSKPLGHAALLFNPASVVIHAISGRTTSATIAVIRRRRGALRADVLCPNASGVTAGISGDTIALSVTGSPKQDAHCMLTVRGAGGAFGQVPIAIVAGATLGGPRSGISGGLAITAAPATVNARINVPVGVDLAGGRAPYRVAGCPAKIATIAVDGNRLVVLGRTNGSCTLTVQSADGASLTLPISIGSGAARAPARQPGSDPAMTRQKN